MTLPSGYILRPATVADAGLIQAQRDAMFTDMGEAPERLARVSALGTQWLRSMLASGRYGGLLVEAAREEAAGTVVAGAGVLWTDMPPNADTDACVRAYLLNVYVQPQHRGQRLADTLVQTLLAACRERGVDIVTLTASDAGRPTYERLGFTPQGEMKLRLPSGVGA